MNNNIKINQTQEEIVLNLNITSTTEELIEELKEKLPKLRDFYQSSKIPMRITGKIFSEEETEEIKKMITGEIDIEIKFDNISDLLGLHAIKKTFESTTEITETKFVQNSLRSGQKEEYKGSIVVCGDVNAGAEIIAGGNIIITGSLRGLAHAGANGNVKAIISANIIEITQIRIANLVKEITEKLEKNHVCKIESNEIKII